MPERGDCLVRLPPLSAEDVAILEDVVRDEQIAARLAQHFSISKHPRKMGLVHEICYTRTSTDTDKYSKHGMQYTRRVILEKWQSIFRQHREYGMENVYRQCVSPYIQ